MKIRLIKCCAFLTCYLSLGLLSVPANAKAPKKDFYEIQVYHFKNSEQQAALDQYIRDAFLPALHRAGIKKIGVFRPISSDTAQLKTLYVFIPFRAMKEWEKLPRVLEKDAAYISGSRTFTDAPADKKPFDRLETILIDAFPLHTQFELSGLTNPLTERIYELRSYESPTPHLYKTKVRMFNEGGEIALFKRLGFNAIFYGSVLAGAKMPNLMYMISFQNMAEHDAHWKAFVDSPEWKTLTAMPEYENKVSVSHIDSILMHAAEYSDI
jgi:hypothetical protein